MPVSASSQLQIPRRGSVGKIQPFRVGGGDLVEHYIGGNLDRIRFKVGVPRGGPDLSAPERLADHPQVLGEGGGGRGVALAQIVDADIVFPARH